jgi:F0F1-type ATP synthase assembly protein I
VVIGWAIGLALDHWLNLRWMNIAGLIAGAIAGFIQTVRVAMSHNKD